MTTRSFPGLRAYMDAHSLATDDDLMNHAVATATGSINQRMAALYRNLRAAAVAHEHAWIVVNDVGNTINISLDGAFCPHICTLLLT